MPLAESVEQKIKNFTLDEKVEVIQMLLNMLTNLHQNGIAHRDINLRTFFVITESLFYRILALYILKVRNSRRQ